SRIDEVNRYQAFARRHLRPVADTADMPGIAQRYRGKSRLLALVDAGLHRKRRNGLAVTETAINHGQRRSVDDDLGALIGNDIARVLPADVDGHADHSVAVMAGEICSREIGRDAPCFLAGGFGVGKNVRDEIDEVVDLDGDHVRIFSRVPWRLSPRCSSRQAVFLAPVLLTGLAGTLSEKSLQCPLPRPSLVNDCNHLPSGYAPYW